MAPATGEARPAIAQEKKSEDANNDENGVVKFSLPVPISSVDRSEEHTSELQSRSDLVCRLLLEKKKTLYSRVRMLKRIPARTQDVLNGELAIRMAGL